MENITNNKTDMVKGVAVMAVVATVWMFFIQIGSTLAMWATAKTIIGACKVIEFVQKAIKK